MTRIQPATIALVVDTHPIQPISPPLMYQSTRSKIDAALLLALVLLHAERGDAEPLRLRGDALVQTSSPVGLVMLRGEDRLKPWLDVETVTWMGATGGAESFGATGDVLTLSIRARDLATGSEIRTGRMLVSMGAVRPTHIDGVRALGRAFGGTTLETFGGVPVVRVDSGAGRPFDWTAGGRIGQAASDVAAIGGSYVVRRHEGQLDEEEAGADFAFTPTKWFTAAGRAAFDLVTYGPTDALASISVQKDDVRVEAFSTHRSPGRMLPSTSLFSVLGDFAATNTGSTLRWRAFPRLELLATGSVQVQGDEVGGQALARTTLALDDEWASSIGLELRRVDFNGARWTGARAIISVPLTGSFHAATELEIVRPDDGRRGTLWPWALGAIAWRSRGWEVAAAVEGSAGPDLREAVHTLGRLSYAFEQASPGRPR